MNPLFLQILNDAVEEPQQEVTLSFFKLVLNGGPVMVPIVILNIIGIYLLIERYITIKKAGKTDPAFMANIKDMVLSGNIVGAKTLCERTNTPMARMMEKGISRIGKPLKNIDVAIQNVGKLEIYKLEKGMATMATISGAAPMLGFLGTVTGMIIAFYNLAMAGNNIDVGLLSGGIYQAMVTTVAGLVVGIFAYVSYNLLSAMIEKVVYKMEAMSVEFIDILQEPA